LHHVVQVQEGVESSIDLHPGGKKKKENSIVEKRVTVLALHPSEKNGAEGCSTFKPTNSSSDGKPKE